MGVAISKTDDPELYDDTYEEAQRIIRISDEVRISLEKISSEEIEKGTSSKENGDVVKLSTSKLAKKLGMKTDEFTKELESKGYIKIEGENEELTEKGKQAGGEKKRGRFGSYFLWVENLSLS